MAQTLFAFRCFPSRGRFEAVHWISLDSSILEVARTQLLLRASAGRKLKKNGGIYGGGGGLLGQAMHLNTTP